ncbi:MAG: helix-turn-helix domain-containing protein [Candidatus Porifericomitaceae bacterium WSBS_2022_MAG_OTU9]
MKSKLNVPIPAIRALNKIGTDINYARRLRRIPLHIMAERSGLSRATITKIEKGSATVSMGGYASVLFVLGMVERLYKLADDVSDTVGLQLERENPPQRIHIPKS